MSGCHGLLLLPKRSQLADNFGWREGGIHGLSFVFGAESGGGLPLRRLRLSAFDRAR
jgi:hypothetical protein